MRTVLPILATLAIAAGLNVPADRAVVSRRLAGGPDVPSRVVSDRAFARPAAQQPDDDLSEGPQELSCGVMLAGLVEPADLVDRSLDSGWWLTPPALIGRDRMSQPEPWAVGGYRPAWSPAVALLIDQNGDGLSREVAPTVLPASGIPQPGMLRSPASPPGTAAIVRA